MDQTRADTSATVVTRMADDKKLYLRRHVPWGSDRLEKWREPVEVATIRRYPKGTGPPGKENRDEDPKARKKAPGNLQFTLMSAAKEVIFDVEDNDRRFHYVTYGINGATDEIELWVSLMSLDNDDDDVLSTLGLAMVFEVPVYPRNDQIAPALARYQARVHAEGFRFAKGLKTRYRPELGVGASPDDAVKQLASQTFLTPADQALIAARLNATLAEHAEAARILASLRAGIEQLKSCLEAEKANEVALQACLKQYPILFGVEYRSVIAKHRLGGEYEMDYALVQASGLVDLVEIEASTHQLYTVKHDPRTALVHAEQQVLDWLDWIERHAEYARKGLPGIARPVGYVVIGRSSAMSDQDKERLRRRNLAFQGHVEVLTYDDLLARAEALVRTLAGSPRES